MVVCGTKGDRVGSHDPCLCVAGRVCVLCETSICVGEPLCVCEALCERHHMCVWETPCA